MRQHPGGYDFLDTRFPAWSNSPASSGTPLFQMADPLPKLNPPHSGRTWLVYTRTTAPGSRTCEGKTNLGLPSAMSSSLHPSRSCGASPRLTISTYSSDSDLTTTPSKKMHSITTPPGPPGEAEPAGVAVGMGVAVGGNGVGVAVGARVAVGLGVAVGTMVAVGMGVAVGARVAVGVGVAVDGGTAVGEGRGVGGGTGLGVGEGSGVAVWVGVGRLARVVVGSDVALATAVAAGVSLRGKAVAVGDGEGERI